MGGAQRAARRLLVGGQPVVLVPEFQASGGVMLALTLWRPWDHSIVHGPKRVENRPWRPPRSVIGTDVALHAGKHYCRDGAAFIRSLGHALPPQGEHRDSVIVGVVRIVRAVNLDAIEGALFATMGTGNQPAADPVEDDPWAFGPWVWVLDNVRTLSEPVPCKGAQGLWALPPDVEARVREQLNRTVEA